MNNTEQIVANITLVVLSMAVLFVWLAYLAVWH